MQQKTNLNLMEKYAKERSMWNCFANSKNSILEFNHYMRSNKLLYIFQINFLNLSLKNIYCKNNPEILPTSKVGRHIPCMYSISRIWTFDYRENKHSLYLRESLNEKVL